MSEPQKPSGSVLAVRCHDITVSLGAKQVGEFDLLSLLGMAVRLSLHLRGVPAVPYDLLRQVGLYLLNIPSTSLSAVVKLLAEVEFVRIYSEGSTIKSVVPTVPYYDDLFSGIGALADNQKLSEPEHLSLTLLDRLAASPTSKDAVNNIGAERKLLEKTIEIGTQGGYILQRRARGRDMLVSPLYFAENPDAFADLAAGKGAGRVAKIIALLAQFQGWPLNVIATTKRIGETTLTDEEVNIVKALAGEGFSPPPSITTSHAGENFFLFSPRPGAVRLAPTQRPIYETAMALVAAVRQGQLLPDAFSIKWPRSLLKSLKDKKYLRANTEAVEQYRTLVSLRLGTLETLGGGWARFNLIETPENFQAVDMAIAMVTGEVKGPVADDDVTLALHKGQDYVDSLVGRQRLVAQDAIALNPDDKIEFENLLMRGKP